MVERVVVASNFANFRVIQSEQGWEQSNFANFRVIQSEQGWEQSNFANFRVIQSEQGWEKRGFCEKCGVAGKIRKTRVRFSPSALFQRRLR